MGRRPRAWRSVQNSWNQPRWPTSHSIGFTIERRGPIHCPSSKSRTSSSVRARASRSSAASGSGTAASILCAAVRVALVCPAPPGSRLGNRITALRWQRMLREMGHRAFIVQPGPAPAADVLLAPPARTSAESVRSAHEQRPGTKIVVALTGTDLYRDVHVDASARRSLELADRLVVLHDGATAELAPRLLPKVYVVPQSAPA